MSQMIQVHVPNFFYFAEILKMTELRPKNRFFGPEMPKDSKKAKTEEDSYSGICQQKLLTKAMFKPLGYDVHNVYISVYIGDWWLSVCMISWFSLGLFTSWQVSTIKCRDVRKSKSPIFRLRIPGHISSFIGSLVSNKRSDVPLSWISLETVQHFLLR